MAHTHSLGPSASILVGVLVGLAVGLAVGALNGFLITAGRITPFIATLGTLGIGAGLAAVISGGSPITDVPSQIGTIANRNVGGWLPALFIVALAVFAYPAWLLPCTHVRIHLP